MGIREFSYPAWGQLGWGRLVLEPDFSLAAGEGSIAGDWEDSCWKTGPWHLLLLCPPQP